MVSGARQILLGLAAGVLLGSIVYVSTPFSLHYRPLAAALILLCWDAVLLMPAQTSDPDGSFRAAFNRLDPARRVKLNALFLATSFAFLYGTGRLPVDEMADRLVALAFAGSFLALSFAVPMPRGIGLRSPVPWLAIVGPLVFLAFWATQR